MRHFLLPLAILLLPAAPALAQVTVDLHALDALPSLPEAPARRSPPSLVPAPRAPVAAAEPAGPGQRPVVAMPASPAIAAQSRPASPAPSAAPPGPSHAAVASVSPTGPASPSAPPPAAPSSTAPARPPAAAPPPPPATMAPTPPAVASIAPIPPPAPPANAAPPPAPPIAADAGSTASATSAGLRLTFAAGKSDLSPGSADSVKHVVQGAPPGDATTFNVLAYAAGDPDDPSVARRLSLERAIAVRSVLMADGVPSSRIYLRALGSEPGQGPPDRVDLSVLGANAPEATGQR